MYSAAEMTKSRNQQTIGSVIHRSMAALYRLPLPGGSPRAGQFHIETIKSYGEVIRRTVAADLGQPLADRSPSHGLFLTAFCQKSAEIDVR